MSDAALLSDGCTRLVSGCQEVLQKPSIASMRERRMVVAVPRTQKEKGEMVYTDSAYWINLVLAKTLAGFGKKEVDATGVETSIYSDFMTCQGSSPEKDHVTHLMSCQEETPAIALKRKICKLMSDVPLFVLALPNSK